MPKDASKSDKVTPKWGVPYERAEVTDSMHSGTIGAGDVGNPYNSSNDAEQDAVNVAGGEKHEGGGKPKV